MSKIQARKPSSISANSRNSSYAHAVLRESANILIKTGHSPEELVREFREICSDIPEPPQPFDHRAVAYTEGLPHIVAHWFTDPLYVDVRGTPIPLRLRARGPCLAALIRRVLPGQNPNEVAESLLRTDTVQRRGSLYRPTDRYVSFIKHTASAQIHGLASVVGMLTTVRHNISCGDDGATLLERAATNPYIPMRALPAVHRRIKREVAALLWKIDGYLRRCEVEPGSEPTTRVGVGAYAYEDPIVTGATARRKAIKSTSQTDRARRRSGRTA